MWKAAILVVVAMSALAMANPVDSIGRFARQVFAEENKKQFNLSVGTDTTVNFGFKKDPKEEFEVKKTSVSLTSAQSAVFGSKCADVATPCRKNKLDAGFDESRHGIGKRTAGFELAINKKLKGYTAEDSQIRVGAASTGVKANFGVIEEGDKAEDVTWDALLGLAPSEYTNALWDSVGGWVSVTKEKNSGSTTFQFGVENPGQCSKDNRAVVTSHKISDTPTWLIPGVEAAAGGEKGTVIVEVRPNDENIYLASKFFKGAGLEKVVNFEADKDDTFKEISLTLDKKTFTISPKLYSAKNDKKFKVKVAQLATEPGTGEPSIVVGNVALEHLCFLMNKENSNYKVGLSAPQQSSAASTTVSVALLSAVMAFWLRQ